MGDRYGPRLVSKTARPADPRSALRGLRIGVPGKLTTAYLTLKLYQPEFIEVVLPFDTIEDAVLRGEVDLGLLIHEGQLTFADRGLHLWTDLGEWWYQDTGLPLPLGGNVVRRDLGPALILQVSRELRARVVYARGQPAAPLAHASKCTRGVGEEPTDRFVAMYVNHWTVDYGDKGREAVRAMLDRAWSAGLVPEKVAVEFV